MQASTQQFVPIKNIKNDLVFLKDGTVSLVLETTAVNFDLLSEREQVAIIESFASLINSLNFMIQIIIRSKKLDISSYLNLLKQAELRQKNPLLKQIMTGYKNFVATIIRENEVLDKQFFVVIPLSYYEVGITNSIEKDLPKILAAVTPRRDHIIKQLARIGLKASQLNTQRLVRLFYDIYNESDIYNQTQPEQAAPQPQAQPTAQPTLSTTPTVNTPTITVQTPHAVFAQPTPAVKPINDAPMQQQISRSVPFVVEELPDEFGALT